jgi:hypothetical protein
MLFVPPSLDLTVLLAKKLKHNWVQNTKIKSKWKSVKRKELESQKDGLQSPTGPNEETDREWSDVDLQPEDDPIAEGEMVFTKPKESQHRIESQRQSAEKPKTQSLREMAKDAYSPSTLHTYKARSLNYNRVPQVSEPVLGRSGLGMGAHKWKRGKGGDENGRTSGRGRGQPNMKLRMGVLLEKIKRDHT